MNKLQARERIEKLRDLINDYRFHYHVLDESTMSEAAADSLKHELSQLEEEFPDLITPDSPTQRVAGMALDKFVKVEHRYPMISLQDVFNREEVEAWIKRTLKLLGGSREAQNSDVAERSVRRGRAAEGAVQRSTVTEQRRPATTQSARNDQSGGLGPADGSGTLEFFCDIKMDGLACSLIYEDGVLIRAVTRGDAKVGEDVTMNIRTIENIPLQLRDSKGYEKFLEGRTEIRGEVVMYKTDFVELNKRREKEGKPVFMNPRNLAAGTIRQLDPKLVAERPLHFHAYDLLRTEPDDVPTHGYAYEAVRALGVTANREAKVFSSIDEVMHFVDEWDEKRLKMKFNTDGLVIKLNDRVLYESLGVVGKTPRGAVAFKYAAEEATTIVRDIVISIGRTGAATPVAVFDPVVVAGTTVQHASLHNADEIARKDIRVGDTVIIFKAGDIIPQVQTVLTDLRPKNTAAFDYEKELVGQYPGLKFERPKGEVVYRVIGDAGNILLKKALEHFASRGALDIDSLGEKNVIALIDAQLVYDIADIYRLKKEDVLRVERFADISATKLIDAIRARRHPMLAKFIYGLGIRHVGTQTAIDLAHAFKSLDSLGTATYKQLLEVDGIGEIVADSILMWFEETDNKKLLAKFRSLDVWPENDKGLNGKLVGQSFVISGTLKTMGRDAAAEKIRALGGTFQSSVARGTTYLVMGEKAGQSKADKARKLGTEVIDEQALLKILDN